MNDIKYATRKTSSENPVINALMREREIAHNNQDDAKVKELNYAIQKERAKNKSKQLQIKRAQFNDIIFSGTAHD